jgi:hypothetical protein
MPLSYWIPYGRGDIHPDVAVARFLFATAESKYLADRPMSRLRAALSFGAVERLRLAILL